MLEIIELYSSCELSYMDRVQDSGLILKKTIVVPQKVTISRIGAGGIERKESTMMAEKRLGWLLREK